MATKKKTVKKAAKKHAKKAKAKKPIKKVVKAKKMVYLLHTIILIHTKV
jgi:hypothetical protein